MVKQKIVISERDNVAALFEDDQLNELIIHRGDVLLGDVYLAQVENILPSIDAAFVNVGTERMGFLHASDVQGKGDLKNRLQPKQRLIVQVIKEPTGHKGPRVTTNLAMPGRFLVLLPDSKGISISRKILNPKERVRLKSILSLIKPPGVGVIIRTEAEEQTDAEIQDDFETLLERWQNVVAMADTGNPPALLHRDQDLLYRVVREFVTEDTSEIVLDTQFGQHRAQQLIQNWGISHPVKVGVYEGNQSILLATGVEKEIRNALQTRVPLPSGGYLYIQPTEALTVIDINSGKFTSLESQEETILHTNLEAAKEIARQLRLRNVGGMIIVDFIDMMSRANQLRVLQEFETYMMSDKGKPQIGQLSDLGLVEMTRHRQGQSLAEIFTKKCHTCHGAMHIVEDFNWASAGGESRYPNQRFPMRQQRPQRGGQQQGAQNGGPRQQQAGVASGKQNLQRQIAPQGGAENFPMRERFLQHAAKVQIQDEQQLTKVAPLDELYAYWLNKKYGIQFAVSAKFAITPIEINSIISRMNPKATDILTLVKAIEIAGHSIDTDDDDDLMDGDEGETNGETDTDESPETELAQNITSTEVTAVATMDPETEVVQYLPEDLQTEGLQIDETLHSRSTYLDEVNDVESLDDQPEEMAAGGNTAVAVAEPPSIEAAPATENAEADDTDEANAAKKRRGRPPKRIKLDTPTE